MQPFRGQQQRSRTRSQRHRSRLRCGDAAQLGPGLLRAWKELAGPEEVLEALRTQGHMDEEEQPWSAH
eukprot:4338078-Prymnesium_polylepis.1